MWKGISSLSMNVKQLLRVRFHVINNDTIQSDVYGGVRFHREHYQRVLEAKQEILKNKLG